MLSASYWRVRRQRESHSVSVFWLGTVSGLLFPMWVMTLISIVFQKVDAFQPLRTEIARAQTFIWIASWLTGWWISYKFIQNNPAIFTEKLTPEAYRAGNVYAILLLACTVGVFGYTLLSLGKM